jgi:hypothetical protein
LRGALIDYAERHLGSVQGMTLPYMHKCIELGRAGRWDTWIIAQCGRCGHRLHARTLYRDGQSICSIAAVSSMQCVPSPVYMTFIALCRYSHHTAIYVYVISLAREEPDTP